ncbi:MAG: pentapeptide repeat-containing protein, partial [Waterburya sp.]
TDFSGANLTRANLKEVDLDASLRGANLTDANLESANIDGAFFENTTMPDGSFLTRSPLRRYKLGVIIAKADGDVYYAQCPDLENCEVSADSLEEARENIRQAVREYLDALPKNYRRVFIDRHVITEVLEIPS